MSSISELVEQCLIASAWIKAESTVLNTPELFQIINSSAPYGFLNGIYRTNLPHHNVEEKILSLYQTYKKQNISFRWYNHEHSNPNNLKERLDVLKPSSITEMQGLYIQQEQFFLNLPEHITVEELSIKNLDDYILANVEGWGQKGQEAEKIRAEITNDFKNGMTFRAFLARYKEEPAATGMLRLVNGSGYLLGGSCRPEFRGRGAYRGLVAHRLKLLRNQNIPQALVLARKSSSAPICKKLGFQVGCECQSYDFNFC